MKQIDALRMITTNEDMSNKTYHIKLPIEHIVRVTETWASLLAPSRPTIQIRDVRGSQSFLATEFVITIIPPITPEHQPWIDMVCGMEGAEVFIS